MDLTEITTLLLSRIGLDHDTIGEKSIELAVKERLKRRQIESLEEYYRVLLEQPLELQALTEEVVVPETWFFRGLEQFRFLVEVAQRRPSASVLAPLRVLSIPCSTGEEPYSICMFLRHAEFLPEQIQITAVDISQRAIEKALQGEYSDLSFREKEPLCDILRHRFVERTATNRVVDEIRSTVQFRKDNLLSPTFLHDVGKFDIIFCRNVLIYFGQDARKSAIKSLDRLLAPNGILFGGHADSISIIDPRWCNAGPPGAFAYQRGEAAGAEPRKPTFTFEPSISKPKPAAPMSKTLPAKVTSATRPIATGEPNAKLAEAPADLLAGAKVAANVGRLADARSLCERALLQSGPTAQAFCLMGVIQQATGELADAEKSFQKAVYLDPAHQDALWQLSLLAERRGDQQAAVNFKRRHARVTGK